MISIFVMNGEEMTGFVIELSTAPSAEEAMDL